MLSILYLALRVPTFQVTEGILWIMAAVLIGLTLLLFITSLVARTRHWSYEQLVQSYQNKHYPLILGYLTGEYSKQEVESQFRGQGIEFSVFEDIIFEMLENLQGEDAEKLRELLFLTPIFEHHIRQLNDSDTIECIKACNYFHYIHLVNDEVILRLLSLLGSSDKMLVFSAASSLMASNDVEVRRLALEEIACRSDYSRMALLEMVYNFQNGKENQMDAEAQVLQNLITDKRVSPGSAAVLIEGAIEIGYMQLNTFFGQKLTSTEKRWRHPEVLKVLIKAQGSFYNWEALSLLKKFIDHPDPDVRIAVARALGQFNDRESLENVYQLLHDQEYRVRVAAAKSLHENDEYGHQLLQASYQQKDLNIQYIIESI